VPGAVVSVRFAVADECDVGAQAPDEARVAEGGHDVAAGVGGVAFVAAVLGDHNVAVVIETYQVAGAHFFFVFGGL